MPRSWINGLGKGSYDVVEITIELDHDPHPTLGASLPEQPLSARRGVGLSVGGIFDGQHDVSQRFGDLRVSFASMIPSAPAEFNGTTVWASDKKIHRR